MRAFLAVELPTALRNALAGVHADLVSADAGWCGASWVAPENLHITVKFLGNIEPADAEALCELLRPTLAAVAPPALDLTGLHVEPRARRARMLWATVHDAGARLARVAEIVETLSPQAHSESRTRPFRPHITLARTKRPTCASEEAAHSAEEMLLARLPGETKAVSVPCIRLVHSTLTPHGPIYRTVSEIPIGID